jgi:hypothetical protein
MKKIVILAVMMFAVALWFGSTVSAGNGGPPPCDFYVDDVNDGCGPDGHDNPNDPRRDVFEVRVSSVGGTTDKITVEVVLCAFGAVDDKTKYRVHFDYKHLVFQDPLWVEVIGPDTVPNGGCVTTSDDTIKLFKGDRTTGPESDEEVSITEGTDPVKTILTFEVDYADLKVGTTPLDTGDIVYIWVDTQHKGIQDRAPSTDDACSKPNECDEVIRHTLN